MTFFDVWKSFNSHFDTSGSPAHEQLVGYKILALFNARMFQEELKVSDRELQRLTGIKSTQSIVDARRRLKNAGLIDFKASKSGTTYRLSTIQTLSNHGASTSQSLGKQSSRLTTPVSSTPKQTQTETKTARMREETGEWAAYRRYGIEGGECPKGGERDEP